MKIADIKELTIDDIKAKIAEEKLALDKLKVNHKVSQLESPMAIRKSRKFIARLSTVLNHKLVQQ